MSLWVCACEPVCLWTHTSTHVCTDPCETPCVCMYGAIWTHGCFGQGLGLTPSKTLAPARGAQGVPAPSPLLSGGARSLSSHRSPSPPTAAPWGSVLGLRGGGVKTNQGCEETGAACGRGATAAQAGVGAGDECMERWGQQCPPPQQHQVWGEERSWGWQDPVHPLWGSPPHSCPQLCPQLPPCNRMSAMVLGVFVPSPAPAPGNPLIGLMREAEPLC